MKFRSNIYWNGVNCIVHGMVLGSIARIELLRELIDSILEDPIVVSGGMKKLDQTRKVTTCNIYLDIKLPRIEEYR